MAELAKFRKRRRQRRHAAETANKLPIDANIKFPEGFRLVFSEETLAALPKPAPIPLKAKPSPEDSDEIRRILDRPNFPNSAPEAVQYYEEKSKGLLDGPDLDCLGRKSNWILLFIRRVGTFIRCLGDVLHPALLPKIWQPHAEQILQRKLLQKWSATHTQELTAITTLRDTALMAAVTLQIASEKRDGTERSDFIAEQSQEAFKEVESFFVLRAEQARKREERLSKREDDPRDWSHEFTAKCVKLMTTVLYQHAASITRARSAGISLKLEGFSKALPNEDFNGGDEAYKAWKEWFMSWLDSCSRKGVIDREIWNRRRTSLIEREIIPEIHRRWGAGTL